MQSRARCVAACRLPLATPDSPLPSTVSFSAYTLTHAHASLLAQKRQLLNDFEEKKLKAAQEAQKAALRNRILVVGTVVCLLMAIIASVGVTICWVRVRRVADRYEVRHSNLAPTENCRRSPRKSSLRSVSGVTVASDPRPHGGQGTRGSLRFRQGAPAVAETAQRGCHLSACGSRR